VACEWGEKNGVTFDHDKSEAVLSSRKRKTPHSDGQDRRKRNPVQQRSDPMAWNMAGFPLHAKGSLENDDEEREKRTG